MVPCYYGNVGDRVAVGTDASSIISNLDIPSRINWEVIASSLLSPDLRLHDSALKGISEVIPGEMVVVDPHGTRREILWNIGETFCKNQKATFEEAVDILEQTLVDTIQAWCARYDNPAIAVSGGLDSSIVAGIAARVSPVSLLHFLTSVEGEGERYYAELLSGYLKIPLNCVASNVTRIRVSENRSSFRPRPSARLFTQDYDDAAARHVENGRNSAHFNGGGGDNVLGRLHSAYPLSDLQMTEGFSWGLFHVAIDICHATGASLPDVLKQGIGATLKKDMLVSWPHNKELLTKRAISLYPDECHPWLKVTQSQLPGQKQLVRSIARGTASTDYLNILGDVPTIYPLLSQPLLEACLSFPTWLSVSGGRDRAVARAAMQKYLPPELANRTTKGAFDTIPYRILGANRERVFGDLEAGFLAEQDLLDVKAIKEVRQDHTFRSIRPSRILHIHEVETWCRNWS
ncbi:asparagine synthetase B family protein [Novosphingobium sp. TCA1]|uniref:asparagine synthase-related protein n=1 Tax=Novosphingobium sp. TCA1 TaxID=2682474 RepID=UPI0013599F84|nr:asparagine synthetase B family protein [Novosphingobium sp. TCA1]